jgi:hypothetical protein
MIDDLTSPTGECYMAPGIDIFAEYIDQGIRFTWPTISQGRQKRGPIAPLACRLRAARVLPKGCLPLLKCPLPSK